MRRLKSMDFVMKPSACAQSQGLFVMTSRRWKQEGWSIVNLTTRALSIARLQCDLEQKGNPPRTQAVGIMVMELVPPLVGGSGSSGPEPLREQFVLELRAYVIGGKFYAGMYMHAGNGAGGSGPMVYFMRDGSVSWRGCQYDKGLRGNMSKCVAHLKAKPNRQETLPDTGLIDLVLDTLKKHFTEVRDRSELLAKALGIPYIRLDWFVLEDRVLFNECTFASDVLVPGHSYRLYSVLLAGRNLNDQGATGYSKAMQYKHKYTVRPT